MSKRDELIDLIGAYGVAASQLQESRNMTEASLRAVKLFQANLAIVSFVDKHYELKGTSK